MLTKISSPFSKGDFFWTPILDGLPSTQVDQVISAEASAAERMKQMKLTVGIWIWMALGGKMMEHGQDIIY